MEAILLVNSELLVSFSLGVLYTSTYINQNNFPKSPAPFGLGFTLLVMVCFSMAFIHLIAQGVFNGNLDKNFLERYIKSILKIGVIILPILLTCVVLFFENFINYLLGKNELLYNEKRFAESLERKHSYKILASKSDPTATNTNPCIIPYEIF